MTLRYTVAIPFLFVSSMAFADPIPTPDVSLPAAELPTPGSEAADKPSFDSLDINKDAKVDKTEAAKNDALAGAFDKLDTDKDSALSSVEYTAWK